MDNILFDVKKLTDKYNEDYQIFIVTGEQDNDRKALSILLSIDSDKPILPLAFIKNSEYENEVISYLNTIGINNAEIYNVASIKPILKNQDDKYNLLNITGNYEDNYFLFIISLSIARAEAVGAKKIWIPIEEESLARITYSPIEYINAIQKLAVVGAIYNEGLTLEFPLIDRQKKALKYNYFDQKEKNISDKVTVLYSGGLDSTAAAYIMQKLGKKLNLFNIKYGQSNRVQENICIKRGCKALEKNGNVEFESIDFGCIKQFGGSAIIDDEVKLIKENTYLEYVPFRNTIFINLSIIYSLNKGIYTIVTGGHRDDNLSPDNNLEYFEAFQNVLKLQYCTNKVNLYPVLLYLGGKPELIYVLEKLNCNFANCWSCLSNIGEDRELINCGECGNCSTRYWAFKKMKISDPIPYKMIPHKRNRWYGWANESIEILRKLGIDKPNS